MPLSSGAAGGASFVVSGAEAFNGTSPTSWTDLDLSSIIGANSALVILRIIAGADLNAVAVRTKGDPNEYFNAAVESNAYGCALGHHDSTADLVLMCVTSTSGMIEWITEAQKIAAIYVIAYIK